jgi:hypothetical protein
VQQDARELAAAERRRRDGERVDVGGEEAVVVVGDLGVADGTGRPVSAMPPVRPLQKPSALARTKPRVSGAPTSRM